MNNLIPHCQLFTARSGAEGIEKAKAELPDTILLDVIMPEMDGFEACRILKFDEDTKHIPVIMLTAIKTDSKSRANGLEMGADAFLSKPVDEAELAAQLDAMLRIKKAEDLLRKEKELLEDEVTRRTEALMESEKRLEAQLQQAQKMEAIGTLASGIAHDFNNILSPIMIHSEMAMIELAHDHPLQHNLKQIFLAGERARDLVKQILTFSRQSKQERTPLKIGLIVKEIIKLLRASLPSTIEIHQHIEAESDTVLADRTQIHQIFLNLCTNAAHAMRDESGVLEVIVAGELMDSEAVGQFSALNPGFYLRLTVSDTGHGIDDEVINRIFEPYFTTKEPGKGTGMGLAVVHGIVKSYGGDITVESKPGKGTAFHVLLPRIEADALSITEKKVEIPRGTERILCVDDEKVAIDIIQRMLENLGYKVTARTSSVETLEVFKNKPDAFDLVITDMTMPNMTGKELAKELMSIRPDIPMILFYVPVSANRSMKTGL